MAAKMVFLANLLAFSGLIALGYMFKSIEWTWGYETVITFCFGWIGATILWQCAHKMRYGRWFDPPDIKDGET